MCFDCLQTNKLRKKNAKLNECTKLQISELCQQNMIENEAQCNNATFGTQNLPFNMCFIA